MNSNGVNYYWVAFRAFNARLRVGSYVGNGTTQSPTGFGFSPEYVMVASAGANQAVQRSSTMGTTFRFDDVAATANGITTLGADGFSVGNSAQANTNGTTYHYVAWNAVPEAMGTGSYTGTGVDNRAITVPTFAPQYVIVKSNTTGAGGGCDLPVHRPASLAGDSTLNFTNVANLTDVIQALTGTGFQVGTNCRVNTNTATYHWVAFRDP